MMLITNSCLAALILGCDLFSLRIFTFQNDLKQIQYQDSLCVFRAYIGYVSYALLNFSFLLQAVYRYVSVVYPNRLFWRSVRFQTLLICLTWIFSFIYPIPFIFTGEIIYNIDNQICQIPLRLSFSVIYGAHCIYIIPVLMIILLYFKLVWYIYEMNKHVIPFNILLRARRELKIVQRTVILITILVTLGFPYGLFVVMSFFNNAPKYHFRIAYIFLDVSLLSAMIALFQFTNPLKAFFMKKINRRTIMATVRVT